jgi:hypothetical protein
MPSSIFRAFSYTFFCAFFYPDQPIQSRNTSAQYTLLPADFLIQEGTQAQPQLPQR